jgi:hypothetical protein
MTCEIFLIARLLADEHNRGWDVPLAKDRLGGVLVQIASGTAGCRLS